MIRVYLTALLLTSLLTGQVNTEAMRRADSSLG